MYHSTLGWRIMKKKKKDAGGGVDGSGFRGQGFGNIVYTATSIRRGS